MMFLAKVHLRDTLSLWYLLVPVLACVILLLLKVLVIHS